MEILEEKIKILENAVQCLKKLRSGSIPVDEYNNFIDDSQKIANILKEKGLGEFNFKRPGSSTFVPTNIFANFRSIHEMYIKRERGYQFITDCISTLNAGIYASEEDLKSSKSGEKKEVKGKMKFNFGNEIGKLKQTLEELIYLQIIMNPSLYWKKSRSVSDARKKAVKKRDKFQCQLCQEEFIEEELEVDHIFPYSLGGSNEPINLMSLCTECNSDKGKRLEYYQSDEGQIKLRLNIQEFLKNLLIVTDFGSWLGNMSDLRRKS